MSTLELAAFAAVTLVGIAVFVRVSHGGSRRARWAIGVVTAYAALSAALVLPRPPPIAEALAAYLPRQTETGGYVSSDACRSCHPGEHQSWHRSYHRTMTELATPQSVRADFAVKRLELDGRTYELSQRDSEYWVSLPDPDSTATRDAPRVERRVVMVTGSHHYQAYWLPGRLGRELRQLPFVWLLDEQRFVPRRDAFLQPPDAPEYHARWNTNCVQCHSVAGRPRHDSKNDRFETETAELGIACEACHGPGGEHVRRYQNPLARYTQHVRGAPDPTIVNPARLSAERASAVCGQCHSYFVPRDDSEWWSDGHARTFRPGESLERSRHVLDYFADRERAPELISASFDSVFWPDGTIRVGGRELNGLYRSPCYEQGHDARKLSCLSCHSMHRSDPDDQLAQGMRTNAACKTCHADLVARASEHSHHPAGSSGSLCYGCHMPETTYALFKGIGSHRITSPDVRQSWETGTLNACNLCHLDRTLGWTARWLAEWYGADRLAEVDGDGVAASVRWLLAGDAATRVVTAWAMGTENARRASGDDWQAPLLAELLVDPYAAVRRVAGRSLRSLPGYRDLDYDFIAAPERQRRARAQALRTWPGSRRRDRALLLDRMGNDRSIAVAELLASRDDRPISIAE